MLVPRTWRDTPMWAHLRELIIEYGIKRGDFTLSSGGQSTILFDINQVVMRSDGALMMASMLVRDLENLKVNNVGGLVMGAIPFATSIVANSRCAGWPVDGFYVRKDPKGHGQEQLIEGVIPGERGCVFLDDVAAQGASLARAARAMEGSYRKGDPQYAYVVIDREEGATEYLAERGITLCSLYKKSDFVEEISG